MKSYKLESTKKHMDSVKKAVVLYEGQENMAKDLGVNIANISFWVNGRQVIPIHHAEKVADRFNKYLSFLDLRPDFKKFEKYFK